MASTGEVFWAVRRFLEALALRRPLVIVLEDVHWAEPTLLDLVEYLGAWTADAPLLVVCLARPDLLEQRPGWAEQEDARAPGLGTAEAQTLVAELSSDEVLEEAKRASSRSPKPTPCTSSSCSRSRRRLGQKRWRPCADW